MPYKLIAPYMISEHLAAMARQKISRKVLVSLSRNKLMDEDRFLLWEDVLSAVNELPAAWRAEIWLDVLHSSETWTPRERDGSIPYCNSRYYKSEEVSKRVISSKWLVDAPLVRRWYCRLHKPGYEILNCMDKTREVNYPLRDKMLVFISQDDLPGFGLRHTMNGKATGWTLVKDVLSYKAKAIFAWLVDNDETMFRNIKPYQLMVYAVSNLKSPMATHVIKCIENRFPGTASKTDAFGYNLLWYSMHNRNILWFKENSRLASFLCDCGCRRDAINHLGLSFDNIIQAMTPVQMWDATRIAHRLSISKEWDDIT